jgi:hypothetical protein
MENEIYQTNSDYTMQQIEELEAWFDEHIGTEIEITSDVDNQQCYLMCFDMNIREVNRARNFENKFRKKGNMSHE